MLLAALGSLDETGGFAATTLELDLGTRKLAVRSELSAMRFAAAWESGER